jgi:hypothetical protein
MVATGLSEAQSIPKFWGFGRSGSDDWLWTGSTGSTTRYTMKGPYYHSRRHRWIEEMKLWQVIVSRRGLLSWDGVGSVSKSVSLHSQQSRAASAHRGCRSGVNDRVSWLLAVSPFFLSHSQTPGSLRTSCSMQILQQQQVPRKSRTHASSASNVVFYALGMPILCTRSGNGVYQ